MSETTILLLKELQHLMRFMEPLEEAGQLPAGLATLNGARRAIELAVKDCYRIRCGYLYNNCGIICRCHKLSDEVYASEVTAFLETPAGWYYSEELDEVLCPECHKRMLAEDGCQ